jgi:hypothetical protein
VKRRRVVFVCAAAIAFAGAAVSCGLDLVGQLETPAGDGGGDAHLPDGATIDGPTAGDGGSGDVAPGDAEPDVDLVALCAATCPALDGGCDGGRCFVTCTKTTCTGGIACPAGLPCTIDCAGNGACSGPIDCTKARGCRVDCEGDDTTCSSSITCNGNNCEINCKGPASCAAATIACNAKDHCGISCDDGDCKDASITCVAPHCDVSCGKGKACNGPIAVNAGDASIVCIDDDCDGGITCSGGSCYVACGGPKACDNGVCCDAGTCLLDAAAPATRSCF